MSTPNRIGFQAVAPGRHGTTAVEIAAHLRGMIHRGELRPGDRLPTERELARLFGVSRPTLRAGISSLSAVGVIRSRSGTGTFVAEAEGSPSLDSGPLHLMASLHGFTSAEILEARRSLEMVIAGLAAERATAEQLAGMTEEITEMYASLDEPEKFLSHDMRFHQTVAAASGNRILTSLMNMVATIQFESRRKTIRQTKDLKELAERHRHVYCAIRNRSPEAARNAMRDHLALEQQAQGSEKSGDPATKDKSGNDHLLDGESLRD